MTEAEKLDASEKRLRRFVKLIVIGVVVGTATMAFFYINQHFAHEDAKTLSAKAACEAIHKTKKALERITEHTLEKSIENVEAGITSSTTSIEEVENFYGGTIEEIEEISCQERVVAHED